MTMPRQAVHVAWFAAGSAIAFAVPFVLTSLLDVNHDAYYGLYFASAIGMIGAYMMTTGARPSMSRSAVLLSLAIGVASAAFVVWNVVREDATPRPGIAAPPEDAVYARRIGPPDYLPFRTHQKRKSATARLEIRIRTG
jgi:hypothetical protein